IAFACAIPHPRADARASHPFRGITYIDRTEASPRPLHMHIAQIDLTTPGLRLKLSPPKPPLEVVRQATLAYLKEAHAQIAINAHFFWPWPSDELASSLVGIAASDGTIYSAFEHPIQRYAIVDEAPGLNIDRENRAAIVHHDPASRDATRIVEAVTLWNTVSGSAQIVTQGEVTVPEYRDAQHPGGLLEPGGPGNYSNAHSWYDVLVARTAIGLSRDARTLTLFTVDARGGSGGMRLTEVARMLTKDYAVWNALNLDGGGSTSMAMADPSNGIASIVNVSSDNPAGRRVGSSLAVLAPAR
ncbi:MAG TPA: phosphodiester glycosidase family protein, partial [Thermoanaerobaculia bacterium]|nr:phosphodiester glycosidase family protein [Thermoanaerobaculia bacterium]